MPSLKMATIHLWIDVAPFVCGGVFGLIPGSGSAARRRCPKSNALECGQLQSKQALRPVVRLMCYLADGMNYFLSKNVSNTILFLKIGSLIKHQLVAHLALGIALRGVLDALRKSVDSKVF